MLTYADVWPMLSRLSVPGNTKIKYLTQTFRYRSIRQHTSAYVSIRQHTSAYVSIRQHTSAYVSIRQHENQVPHPNLQVSQLSLLALLVHQYYRSIRQHTSAYVSIRQHTSGIATEFTCFTSTPVLSQHTSAYVSIRQHTSAYVRAYVRYRN
jgi:hypothetical protein